MALRVLLADESTTIKKVIQLALQDYGVEVKSVPIGLDVLPVAKTFQPDLIFVDVLLQKKSGYEVAKEIKEDSQLSPIPVVLMWSGFMEIDEAKVQSSRANARLEKPFDAEILRKLVKDLVPRTLENKVSGYLTFPQLPNFSEDPPPPSLNKASATAAAPASATKANPLKPKQDAPSAPPESTSTFSMPPSEPKIDSLYDIPELDENQLIVGDLPEEDQFSNVPLAATKGPGPSPEESWSHQDLSKFKIQIPEENPLVSDLEKFMIHPEDLDLAQVESSGEFEEVTFASPPAKQQPTPPPQQQAAEPPREAPARQEAGPRSAMDQVAAERLLKDESHALIEKILWQILPGICERVVREELNKLLKDVEKSV